MGEPIVPVSLPSCHPLYILYTSGAAGIPKGVLRNNGGHAVTLTYSMRNLYNVAAEEVFWAASDVGWVVSHSYIFYGSLFAGLTTILFEGKPVRAPDPRTFRRILFHHKANVFSPRQRHSERFERKVLKRVRCQSITSVIFAPYLLLVNEQTLQPINDCARYWASP